MPTTRILIADGARARLLEQDRKSRHFNRFGAGIFRQQGAEQEIVSDDRGRSFDSAARGQPGDVGHGPHAMEPSDRSATLRRIRVRPRSRGYLEKRRTSTGSTVSSWSLRPRRWAICAVFCPRRCRAG